MYSQGCWKDKGGDPTTLVVGCRHENIEKKNKKGGWSVTCPDRWPRGQGHGNSTKQKNVSAKNSGVRMPKNKKVQSLASHQGKRESSCRNTRILAVNRTLVLRDRRFGARRPRRDLRIQSVRFSWQLFSFTRKNSGRFRITSCLR